MLLHFLTAKPFQHYDSFACFHGLPQIILVTAPSNQGTAHPILSVSCSLYVPVLIFKRSKKSICPNLPGLV